MIRHRLTGWRVVPIVYADDGESLTPVPVGPLDIPLAQWEQFKAGGDAQAIEDLQRQLEPPKEPVKPSRRRSNGETRT